MKPARSHYGKHSHQAGLGPALGFAATAFAGLAACIALAAMVSSDAVMPVIATLFLAAAAGFGLLAWYHRDENPERVTYGDVAGALTLIGLFAAAIIDPEQLVRIAAAGRDDN
jgi:hypothetical protein